MSQLHFSMVFSGTVSPNGNDPEANDIAMTRDDLNANLEQAIANITGNGMVTGETPATLEGHSYSVQITTHKFDMMAMPVISTAHLDSDTAQALTASAGQCKWATVACYPEGFFIGFFDEGHDAEMPESARAIHQWLKGQNLNRWVRLDCDWDTVDGLPAYVW